MNFKTSKAFRGLCLALAMLTLSWSWAGVVYADVYPLNVMKTITDARKPNVLILLETAESMQGLPGETAAPYNQVGADCEDGNRYCRLNGQVGRWAFSGMGSQGMYFGTPPSSCTGTVSNTSTETVEQTTTATNTATNTYTQAGTSTQTQTEPQTGTATQTPSGTSTTSSTSTATQATATSTRTATSSSSSTQTETNPTYTATQTKTTSSTSTTTQTNPTNTQSTTSTWSNTSPGTATYTGVTTTVTTNSSTSTYLQTGTATAAANGVPLTGNLTALATATLYYVAPLTRTQTATTNSYNPAGNYSATANATNTLTLTYTFTSGTATQTTTSIQVASAIVTGAATTNAITTITAVANATTGSKTATASGVGLGGYLNFTWTYIGVTTMTNTGTATGTATATGTLTNTTPLTNTGVTTGTAYVTSTIPTTVTGTGTGTYPLTRTVTTTNSGTGIETWTPTITVTLTNTATSLSTITPTITNTTTRTVTAVITGTNTLVSTSDITETLTNTVTNTVTSTSTVFTCGSLGQTDTAPCNIVKPTSTGFCDAALGTPCTLDSTCHGAIRGDFCRFISVNDGSGRLQGDQCIESAGSPWGACKQGISQAGSTCANSSDTTCANTLPGDYCAEGASVRMCSETGIWCLSSSACPGGTNDTCVPATSRLMITKRALRRAISEFSDKANIGFQTTYQGKGIGANNLSTEIYPYVRLQSCSGGTTVTERKFIPRGELELQGCFSLSSGPSASCTIDYGANGALNTTASLNQITYTRASTDNSRFAIPRADGSGRYDHSDVNWTACNTSTTLPNCDTLSVAGTGVYEGSYYEFSYKVGTPVASGAGSRAAPTYFTTYKGKFYADSATGYCYNAIEADRTDNVNDGIYARRAYTGTSYNVTNEVAAPLTGASAGASACSDTVSALWTPAAVPFLTDTTFGGKAISSSDKALMTIARLEKASQGGVFATGAGAPIGCMLNNDVQSNTQHSAASYMATVDNNQATANGGHAVCQTDNILLVIDGHSTGPGDFGGTVDCGSSACNPSVTPNLAGCNCLAIVKAYNLSHGTKPVTTQVVVNAPASWASRFPYTNAFVTNLAAAGSTDFSGVPSYGTTEDELYAAVAAKLALAVTPFSFTTTSAVSGASSQNSLGVVSTSTLLFDTSIAYPTWKGTLRAFGVDDKTGVSSLLWNAETIRTQNHPADWKSRRIVFGDKSGGIVQLQLNASTGAIANKSQLHTAGLGADANEAEAMMQWLLGRADYTRKNPAPLMGSISQSTPIAVGQPMSSTIFPGSPVYSQQYATRPELVYVGGDDGMLHAFFARDFTESPTYSKGEEAFAFLPNDMLATVAKLYTRAGQSLSPDSDDHIFGLAGSPKVKDICQGSLCAVSSGGDWRTILVMPEGKGGNKPFALNITNVAKADGLHLDQLSLLWGTLPTSSTTYSNALGQTMSTPAFYFNADANFNDYHVLMASGYPVSGGASTQGLKLLDINAWSGSATADSIPTSGAGCSQTRTVLSDLALARNFQATTQDGLAAYFGDTWGNLYQYSLKTRSFISLAAQGCGQPMHFAPAVVQLDRLNGSQSLYPGSVYVVQVTNSNLDAATQTKNGTYPASEMIITKLKSTSGSTPVLDPFASTGTSQIVLSLEPADARNGICVNTAVKKGDTACASGEVLPATARPMGAPTALLRGDGLGFQIITLWWDPASIANDCSSGHEFSYGNSYVTVHEFAADGTWYQVTGQAVTNSVVTGIVFVGMNLFMNGILNGSNDRATLSLGETFNPTQKLANANAVERYLRTGWSELMDM